jgi:O-antigen ligase
MAKFKIIRSFDFLLLTLLCIFIILAPFSKIAVKVILGISVVVASLSVFSKYKFQIMNFDLVSLFSKNPLIKPVLLFLGAAILSTLFSANSAHGQRIVFERYIPFLLFFLLGTLLIKIEKRNFFILCWVFMIFGIVISIGGILDYRMVHWQGRLFTSFGRNITLSNYLVILVPLFSFGVFLIKNRFLWVVSLVGLMCSMPVFIWNGSRGAWFAVILAVLMAVFIKKPKVSIIWVLLVTLMFTILPVFFRERASSTLDVYTWGDRIPLYKAASKVFLHYPLFGSGPGTIEKLLYAFGPAGGYPEGSIHLHAHNTYLEIAAEMGIVGLIMFCAIFVYFFRALFRSKSVWRNDSGDGEALLLGLSTGIFATLIFANGVSIITIGIQDAALFWFILGVATGVLREDLIS